MKVKKDTRIHYEGYIEDGQYHIERLTSKEEYEYDSEENLLCYSYENYDENGAVAYGMHTSRQAIEGGYIYEKFDLEGHKLRSAFILQFIYILPLVFNSHTYGKGLFFHFDAFFIKHMICVSRRMSDRQNKQRTVQSIG